MDNPVNFNPKGIGALVANIFNVVGLSHKEEVSGLYVLLDKYRDTIAAQDRRISELEAKNSPRLMADIKSVRKRLLDIKKHTAVMHTDCSFEGCEYCIILTCADLALGELDSIESAISGRE